MRQTHHLDLVGLKCPQPIVELMKEIKQRSAGEELSATANDPAFELDVQSWCEKTGHELIQIESSEDRVSVRIRKKNEPGRA